MTWRDLGRLALVLLLANLAGLLWSREVGLLVWAIYLTGVLGLAWMTRRRWRRQVAEIGAASEDERDRRIAQLTPDEQALARLALGVRVDSGIDPAEGGRFGYRRTPRLLLALAFWGSVAMSALPLTLLLLGQVRSNQAVWAFAVGAGFAIGAWAAIAAARDETTIIRLTASGIVQERESGERTGILWSEIATVRPRPLLMALEIVAGDGRRIRVGYSLEQFPRFMELLSAQLHLLDDEQEDRPA